MTVVIDNEVGDKHSISHPEPAFQPSFWWVVRSGIAGAVVAAPIALLFPKSPLLNFHGRQELVSKITGQAVFESFAVCSFGAAVTYGLLVEPNVRDMEAAQRGVLPHLGPISAQVPALGAWAFGHAYYPGLFCFLYEKKNQFASYRRLSIRCALAFSWYHIPTALLGGLICGCLMFPAKFLRKRKVRTRRLAETQLEMTSKK